jgi:hypothetical protein
VTNVDTFCVKYLQDNRVKKIKGWIFLLEIPGVGGI